MELYKKQIALRLKPHLLTRIDNIRPLTNFDTRTELIETACATYITFLEEQLENQKAAQ